MTLDEARFQIDRLLLERREAGLSAEIEQIDVVQCETDGDAMAYIYLIQEPEPLTVLFQLPGPFDHRACSRALLHEPGATVH
jgi:hypothetical protein